MNIPHWLVGTDPVVLSNTFLKNYIHTQKINEKKINVTPLLLAFSRLILEDGYVCISNFSKVERSRIKTSEFLAITKTG